ncbi:MAG: prolipoprotein diacylglyceryl transferase [Alphaproteobacteria bacterium]|nr:prolipoprotein diacylglyceryl transferase [Alphaproteobacteria bacterium]
MSIAFPEIDPVIVHLGPLAIRWYSLAYIAGVLAGWKLIKNDLKKHPIEHLTKDRIDDMVIWAIIGIMLGGRLGYTLIYQTEYYLQHPLAILFVWEGGMSFHGGFSGFIAAFFLFCRRHRIGYFQLMDKMAAVAPIGIGLGRLANFINGELWGRVSDVPWAMVFPDADGHPRHPSQLYEAGLEGVLLFVVLFTLLKKTRIREYPGMLCGLFLCGYGLARIFCEYFREPDPQLGYLWAGATMGQLLSLPMLLLGALLLLRAKRA